MILKNGSALTVHFSNFFGHVLEFHTKWKAAWKLYLQIHIFFQFILPGSQSYKPSVITFLMDIFIGIKSLQLNVINIMISNVHKAPYPHHIQDYIWQQANNECKHHVLIPVLTTARKLQIFYSETNFLDD